MRIRIRQLRLRGVEKDYSVSFLDESGNLRPVSTIAGEISTGKTSILEFIDYCLGGSSHPVSIEVKRQARAALLEVEMDNEIVVIERPLFGGGEVATVHRCALAALDAGERHARDMRQIEPTGDSGSLSSLLLSQLGLGGISLKEAPTKDLTDADPLSFRNLMWLSYLSRDRYEERGLLFEQTPPKQLKLRQVIEVVFDVHDNQEAQTAQALKQLEEELARARAEADSLERFLRGEEVPDRIELAAQHEALEQQLSALRFELDQLSEQMRAASGYADAVREEFSLRRKEAGDAAAQVRYEETLIRRLAPLEAQYAEDERKLRFAQEAQTVFDPLQVTICPSCLQRLENVPSDDGGECSLCHQRIVRESDSEFDLKAEIRAVAARGREIGRYIDDARKRLDAAEIAHSQAREAEEAVQRELDDKVASALSPFVAQREQLVRRREEARSALTEIERQQRWQQTLDQRYADIQRLTERATALRRDRLEREGTRANKQDVVTDLTERFDRILRRFGFPKLDDPSRPVLDRYFAPHVRGILFREETSQGARKLIALAWQLAIFQRAVELGHPHPGFLLIDSPQQGLAAPDPEYVSEQIRLNVWDALFEWSAGAGQGAQLVVVENTPPPIAEPTVVVRYGGQYGPPPWGLIDNETG